MKVKANFAAIIVFNLVLAGCSMQQKVFLSANNEPPVIVARNSSNQYIQSITLIFNKGKKDGQEIAGTISPMPQGGSQIYVRPTKQQRLPESVFTEWENTSGRRHNQTVSLKEILSKATGNENERLVFDILSATEIKAYLEYN